MEVHNIGEREAFDLEFWSERAGNMRLSRDRWVMFPVGATPLVDVPLSRGERHQRESVVIRAEYRDFKSHSVRVVLDMEPLGLPCGLETRTLRVIEATLDGKTHPDIPRAPEFPSYWEELIERRRGSRAAKLKQRIAARLPRRGNSGTA